jgi:hypothetical protein
LHAPAALPEGRVYGTPWTEGAGCTPEPVWTFREKKYILSLPNFKKKKKKSSKIQLTAQSSKLSRLIYLLIRYFIAEGEI